MKTLISYENNVTETTESLFVSLMEQVESLHEVVTINDEKVSLFDADFVAGNVAQGLVYFFKTEDNTFLISRKSFAALSIIEDVNGIVIAKITTK